MTTPYLADTDAAIVCRDMGNAELLAYIDVQRYEAADEDEVAAILAHDRLRAGLNELSRRQRLSRTSHDVPHPRDRQYAAWRDVARQVRERADIAAVFAAANYPLTRVGSNSRRGGPEYAGPCLLCGGRDRLRVWAGPNGRYWCRRCRVGGDIIAAAQTLLPDCQEWHVAVSYLARGCGVATPGESINPTPRRRDRSSVRSHLPGVRRHDP